MTKKGEEELKGETRYQTARTRVVHLRLVPEFRYGSWQLAAEGSPYPDLSQIPPMPQLDPELCLTWSLIPRQEERPGSFSQRWFQTL
ncbi:hypothetical protein ACOMHN_011021 [Nucella lapillus]